MLTVQADTLTFALPASPEEITFGQYLHVVQLTTIPAIVQYLSGKTDEEFRPLRAPDLYELAASHLSYLSDLPKAYTHSRPERVTVNGKSITPPKDLGIDCTIGQWQDVQSEIKGMDLPDEVSLDSVAETLLSIFLCPLVTGSPYTDLQQARDIMPIIHAMPCTEALPLAAFFLSSYLQPTPSGMVSFRKSPRPTTPAKWLPSWFPRSMRSLSTLRLSR